MGALLTGVCAAEAMGGSGMALDSMGAQVFAQLKGVVVTIIWSGVVSVIAFKIADLVTGGARVGEDEEDQGLDLNSHGEAGYSS